MIDKLGTSIGVHAISMLNEFRLLDTQSREPGSLIEIGARIGLAEREAEAIFRYLVQQKWLDTFSVPSFGRINARGLEALQAVDRIKKEHSVVTVEGKVDMDWDVFISHASEDKAEIAVPLSERLKEMGLRVWLDKFELTVGDSLRQTIERGLAGSRFGVVIISPDFLNKYWPQAELDGLTAREAAGVKVVLPVWHRVDEAHVRKHSPILAGKLAATTNNGIEHVANQLMRAIQRDTVPRDMVMVPPAAPVIQSLPSDDLRRLSRIAQAFHTEQLKHIMGGNGSIPILDGGALVLHIIPLATLEDGPIGQFDELVKQPTLFPPMKGAQAEIRISYDGIVIGSNARGLDEPQRAYVKIYRNGAVEAVISSLVKGQHTQWVELPYLQALIIRYTMDYIHGLNHCNVAPPFGVSVSLTNMKGADLLQDFKGNAFAEDMPSAKLNSDLLPFGQVVFNSAPPDVHTTARQLKSILSHLANAAGLASPPYFDANGNCTLNL